MTTPPPLNLRQRALAVLAGQPSGPPGAGPPFITRLEAWYKGRLRAGSLPPEFRGLSLPELHRALRVGQLKFAAPYALRLHGVEVTVWRNGSQVFRQSDPLVENFPGMWDFVSTEQAGVTLTELSTRLGKLHLQHVLLPEHVLTGADPYLKTHLIQSPADYRVVEHILERAEFTPLYKRVAAEQESLGEDAFVVPLLHRIPFQQVLLEYLGETALFYALYDEPDRVKRLLQVLDEQLSAILGCLAAFDAPYVEFPDNLHGLITNPRLFRSYCLPAYQKYTQLLHGQGKKAGAHTDGDLRPLLGGLAESGLDVCESFSPAPLTPCTFEEAWQAWRSGPLIWGGIPSPLLEETTPEAELHAYLEGLLALVGGQPILLGVVDLFMPHNSIQRLAHIARRLGGAAPA